MPRKIWFTGGGKGKIDMRIHKEKENGKVDDGGRKERKRKENIRDNH